MSLRLLSRIILPVAAATLAVDQMSKWWVVDVLDLRTRLQIDVLPPYLNLRMAWNEGINFGLFADGAETTRWILIGLSIAISAGLAWWVLRRGHKGMAAGAGLVVGGALGNAWDRLSDWRAVADFINNSCCGINNPFSYNIADIAIFAGALWIAVTA